MAAQHFTNYSTTRSLQLNSRYCNLTQSHSLHLYIIKQPDYYFPEKNVNFVSQILTEGIDKAVSKIKLGNTRDSKPPTAPQVIFLDSSEKSSSISTSQIAAPAAQKKPDNATLENETISIKASSSTNNPNQDTSKILRNEPRPASPIQFLKSASTCTYVTPPLSPTPDEMSESTTKDSNKFNKMM